MLIKKTIYRHLNYRPAERFSIECREIKTKAITVEVAISGHPRESERVSTTGAGPLRECVNTEFV